jgi:hypothetical protein
MAFFFHMDAPGRGMCFVGLTLRSGRRASSVENAVHEIAQMEKQLAGNSA